MMDKNELKIKLTNVKRSYIIGCLTTYFSLVYHLSFLFVFLHLKIYPMFLFNIFSVTLFSTLTLFSRKIKSYTIPYFFGYFEVVLHQILADFFVGSVTSFHFFVFLIGILAFLVIDDNLYLSSFFGFLACIIFILLESFMPYVQPRYSLSESILLTFKILNVTLSVVLIFFVVLLFTYIVWNVEKNLKSKIVEKSNEADIQHKKNFELQESIIHSLASLVENRDSDTGEHIQRTSIYVEMIARRAFEKRLFPKEIDENFINRIKKAAPMHDIGKIVVPDSVLKKPGKLSPEEFSTMQIHTTEGSRIIHEILNVADDKEYIQMADDIATSHHERWDGHGYPYQLLETDIPLSARIMAVADVFDALVSPRCYKDPMPMEKAFDIIKEEAGTHFDPVIAELFLEQKDEIAKVLKVYTR